MQRSLALSLLSWAYFVFGLVLTQPAYSDENDENAQIRDDCRIEGEMAGLRDQDLEEFISYCVADLSAVEFSNMAESDR